MRAGSSCWGRSLSGAVRALDDEQLVWLDRQLQANLYTTAKAVAHLVEERFGVRYTESGMTALLHRLGDVYKKPSVVPGKADPQAQQAFLDEYAKHKQDKAEDDPIYCMDAAHPQHNPVVACGWIKRGEAHAIRTNTGRQRVNIDGAIDLECLEPVVRFDDTINADSSIALFEQLEELNDTATWIYVICANAGY